MKGLQGDANNRSLAGRVAGAAVRAARVASLIGAYAGQAAIGKLLIKDRDTRLGHFAANVGKWSARTLDHLNFRVQPVGHDLQRMRERNFLIVSNHLSYLDILMMASVQPAVFVTSVDLREAFFLGPMAELGGSIFVERRHRGSIDRDLGVIVDTLRAGHHVALYPEGRSSNGEGVLAFKRSLLQAAIEADRAILPVCLKYTEIDGVPFSSCNADKVCWYGDMSFGPHFAALLGLREVKAELHFLEPLEVDKASNRHELAERARAAISAAYHDRTRTAPRAAAPAPFTLPNS